MAYRIEPNPLTGEQELVIDGWENGTGQSPELGVNIKNCNIESITGTVRPNWKSNLSSVAQFTYTFTADAGTDTITLSGAGSTTINMDLQAIQVSNSGGSLPAGLSASTTYYMIITGGLGAGTYKLATTLANAKAGTQIDITGAGTGTQSISNSAVPMGTINYMINVPVTGSGITVFYRFALDNTGQLWFYTSTTSAYDNTASWILISGNTLSNNSGNGLAYIVSSSGVTYLFCVSNGNMDVLNVSTFISAYVATWTTAWMALNSPVGYIYPHFSLLAQDNKIYVCDGRYIDSISEKTGQNFDPTSAPTYTQTLKALSLPSYAQSRCLEELGVNLLIGDKNSNYIYPWDRTSTSFTVPLRVAENNIWRMKNVDNTVFILAGTKGHIFETTGYAVLRVMKVPEYLTGGTVTWGGVEKVSGAFLFGITAPTTAAGGVYKLYSTVGAFAGSIVGSLICDETPSIGATNPTAILSDNVPDEFYFIGYAGGIDLLDNTNRTSNYESYVESDIIPVGTYAQQKTFQNIEYKLDYQPTAGAIRLSMRSNLNGNYTVLTGDSGTENTTGVLSNLYPCGVLQNVQWAQFKVEMKGGTGTNTPRLRELRLR